MRNELLKISRIVLDTCTMPFFSFLINKEHCQNPNHTNVILKEGRSRKMHQPWTTRRCATRAVRGLWWICTCARHIHITFSVGVFFKHERIAGLEMPAGRSCDLLGSFVNVGVQPCFLILLLRGTWGLLFPRGEREHGLHGAFRLGRLAWGFGRTGNLDCCFSEAAKRSVKIILRWKRCFPTNNCLFKKT